MNKKAIIKDGVLSLIFLVLTIFLVINKSSQDLFLNIFIIIYLGFSAYKSILLIKKVNDPKNIVLDVIINIFLAISALVLIFSGYNLLNLFFLILGILMVLVGVFKIYNYFIFKNKQDIKLPAILISGLVYIFLALLLIFFQSFTKEVVRIILALISLFYFILSLRGLVKNLKEKNEYEVIS